MRPSGLRRTRTVVKEYEKSRAPGGLRITVPVDQAVKILAKHKPELKPKGRAPSTFYIYSNKAVPPAPEPNDRNELRQPVIFV